MKILASLTLIIFVVSCNSQPQLWKVVEQVDDKAFNKSKITVRITERISESELDIIANIVKKDNPNLDRIDIFYLLPDMEIGKGAWAASYFDPFLRTKIFGATNDEFSAMKSKEISGELFRKWSDETPYMSSIMALVKENGKMKMKITYSNGEESEKVITSKKNNDLRRLHYPNNHGEYYQIEDNGNLGIYDNEGKIREAKKIN